MLRGSASRLPLSGCLIRLIGKALVFVKFHRLHLPPIHSLADFGATSTHSLTRQFVPI